MSIDEQMPLFATEPEPGLRHFAIERDPDVEGERRRNNPPPQPPRVVGRGGHGGQVAGDVQGAVTLVQAARTAHGVAPDRLLVLSPPGLRGTRITGITGDQGPTRWFQRGSSPKPTAQMTRRADPLVGDGSGGLTLPGGGRSAGVVASGGSPGMATANEVGASRGRAGRDAGDRGSPARGAGGRASPRREHRWPAR